MFPCSDNDRLRVLLAFPVRVKEVSALPIHRPKKSRQHSKHQSLYVEQVFPIVKAVKTKSTPKLPPHFILVASDAASDASLSYVDRHRTVE